MHRLLIALTIVSSVFLSGRAAQAESPSTVTGVSISCACSDPVGQAYVSAVKKLLAGDAHFQQMSLEEGARKGAIRVHIISMPLDSADGTPRAALSVVTTHDGVMIHQFIATCTHLPVAQCAEEMMKSLRTVQD